MNYFYRFTSYVYRKIFKKHDQKIDAPSPTNKSKYKKKSIPKTIRNQVWRKYNGNVLDGKCFCCCEVLKYESWEAGHIIAEANGGKTILENLRPVCLACNRSMGKMNMFDFMKKYHMSGVKNI